MGVTEPSMINAAFADGFNRRYVDALQALYDSDGAVVELDGSVSTGAEAVRAHLTNLVALGGRMTSTNTSTVIVGEIALVTASWVIVDSSVAPEIAGRSAEVLRRQTDGSWAYLIDQPT